MLFAWTPGIPIADHGGTFTRATAARYFDRNGVMQAAASGGLRDRHYESATALRAALLGLASSNLVTAPEDLSSGSWTKTRCTVTSNAELAPDATMTADRIVEDTSVTNSHYVVTAGLTITANANIAYGHWLKAGLNRSAALLKIQDAAATNAVAQAFNLTTGALIGAAQLTGTGTLVRAYVEFGFGANAGYVRCVLVGNIGSGVTSVLGLTALHNGTTTGYTGDGSSYIIAWGAQLENSKNFATAYMGTTARNDDLLSFTIPTALTTPAAHTGYMKFIERGSVLMASNTTLWALSEAGNDNNALRLVRGGAGTYTLVLADAAGVAISQSQTAAAPNIGDTVELRWTISSSGVVTLAQSINGAAEVVATAGATASLPAQWGTGTAKLYVNCRGTGRVGSVALQGLRFASGSTRTLVEMQRTYLSELDVLQADAYRASARVLIQDSDATWQDMTTLGGAALNYLESYEVDHDIDQPVAQATVTFKRDGGGTLSLSPLREDSILNRNAAAAYSALVDIGRRLRVEVAATAWGVAPSGTDWKRLFEGAIDRVEFNEEPLRVTARDDGRELVDTYASLPASYDANTLGALGTALETFIQTYLLTPLLASAPTLYTPVLPSQAVKKFGWDREPVMDIVLRAAQMIGWDVRYLWDSGTSAFRLTLHDPGRTKTTPDAMLPARMCVRAQKMTLDIQNVRNVVEVVYSPTPTGATRAQRSAQDISSIAKYGTRRLHIEEASDSPISSDSEADAMVAAILADLASPKADLGMEILPFWPVELWDLHRYFGNSIHFDQDQDLAVVSVRHTGDAERHRTFIATRGQPAGAYRLWQGRFFVDPTAFMGPSLDVRATPGASSYTITYTGTYDYLEYSVDGGSYGAVPASPFSVTRPAAGANSKALSFRATRDDQVIIDNVTVPAIDQDTVTPDLSVVQTAQTETTTSFQATTSNPQGGAAPTLKVYFVNCTSSTGHTDGQTIASGTTVGVNRPPVTAGQATIRFESTLAGGGKEEISRTVPNKVEDPGTDPENMVLNGGGQTGSVGAQAPSWTNGAGNGLLVQDDNQKFADRSLRTVNGAAVDSYNYQDFAVVDGAFYELSGWIAATSAVSYSPILEAAHQSGGTVTVYDRVGSTYAEDLGVGGGFGVGPGTGSYGFTFVRALFRVATAGTLRVFTRFGGNVDGVHTTTGTAWWDGIKLRRIVRLQPNLRVWAVEGTTSDTIYYEVDVDASLVYRTDNGSDSTPAASGFTVSRNGYGGAKKVLTFTATRAGQSKVCTIEVLAQAPSVVLTLARGTATNAGATGPPFNQLDLSWTVSGMPAGITYDVSYDIDGGSQDFSTGLSATTKTFTSVTFNGSPGKGKVTVTANYNGVSIATRSRNDTFLT
jgi:hypothetical protein